MPYATQPCSPRAALPCSLRVALSCSPRAALPCSPRAALPCIPHDALPCSPRAALPCSPRAALPGCLHALQPARCPARAALQPARCPALQPMCCPATTAITAIATAAARAVTSDALAPLLLTATACHGQYHGTGRHRQSRRQETLSPQKLREWVIQRGRPGGGGYGAGEATSLGASEPGSTCAAFVEALHTFTPDSSTTRCFFRDCTTVTPLTTPVPVSLADPSGGPVVARASTVLPCVAAPSGSLTGFHLPSFSNNLVSNAVLQNQFVTVTTPGGELVAICTDSRTGEHLATFTQSPRSGLHTLTTESAQERYFLLVVDDYTCYTTVFPLWSKADVCGVLIPWITAIRHQLRARFQEDLQVLRLHSDRGGEFSSRLLEGFSRAEGIAQSFTLTASPQQSGIAERRIGLDMEVARTSMIHAAAPHFLWPDLAYTALDGRGWRCVSVSGLGCALCCPRYHRGQALSSHSALRLPWLPRPGSFTTQPCAASCPHRMSPLTSRSASTVSTHSRLLQSPPVDPLPSQGPAPSGVSQVNPSPLVEPLEVSSDTSSPAEGGDSASDDTAATRRSPRLETPPGFLLWLSSPPPQAVAVDSGAAGFGDTEGADSKGAGPEVADSRGAESVGAGSGGAGSGGANTEGAASPSGGGVVGALVGGSNAEQQQQSRQQETLSPQQLRDLVVRQGRVPRAWSIGGGGASAGGAGGTGAARTGGARAGGAGGTGAAGARGSGATGVGGARAGGARCTGAAGAGGTRAAGAGGARARGDGGTGATGTGGARARGAGGIGATCQHIFYMCCLG
ncbi:unnamed protein product [Closterium sp. NIES-53]